MTERRLSIILEARDKASQIIAGLKSQFGALQGRIHTAGTELNRLETEGNQAAASQRRLAQSHDQVSRASHKANLATQALRRVYRQLWSAVIAFVGAYAFIRFFKDSVKQFLESQAAAKGLKEKITALGEAWWQLKAQVGAVIVELFAADSATGSLTERVDGLSRSVGENAERIVAWAMVIQVAVRRVGQVVGGVIKLLFNVGQVIGNTIEAAFAGLAASIDGLVNLAIKGLNRLGDAHNALAKVMPGMREFVPIGTVDLMPDWVRSPGEIRAALEKDLGDALKALEMMGEGTVEIWNEVGEAVARARATARGEFDALVRPTGGGAGRAGSDVQDFRRADARRERAAGRALGPLQRRRMAIRGHEGLSGLGPVSGTEMSPLEGLDRISVPELPDIADPITSGLDAAEAGFGAFLSTWQSGIAAMIESSGSLGKAFGGAIAAGVAAAAGQKAAFHLAEGVGALAVGIMGGPLAAKAFASAAKHFKSAAMFGALAGGAGGLGGAMGGGGGGGGRGGIRDQHERGIGAGQSQTTIQLVGDGISFRDPRQVRALADVIAKASGNRVLVTTSNGRLTTR